MNRLFVTSSPVFVAISSMSLSIVFTPNAVLANHTVAVPQFLCKELSIVDLMSTYPLVAWKVV